MSGQDMADGVGTKLASGLAGGAKGLVSPVGKHLLSNAGDKVGGITGGRQLGQGGRLAQRLASSVGQGRWPPASIDAICPVEEP